MIHDEHEWKQVYVNCKMKKQNCSPGRNNEAAQV